MPFNFWNNLFSREPKASTPYLCSNPLVKLYVSVIFTGVASFPDQSV